MCGGNGRKTLDPMWKRSIGRSSGMEDLDVDSMDYLATEESQTLCTWCHWENSALGAIFCALCGQALPRRTKEEEAVAAAMRANEEEEAVGAVKRAQEEEEEAVGAAVRAKEEEEEAVGAAVRAEEEEQDLPPDWAGDDEQPLPNEEYAEAKETPGSSSSVPSSLPRSTAPRPSPVPYPSPYDGPTRTAKAPLAAPA